MRTALVIVSAACGLLVSRTACAHDGPPYPIVSNQVLGAFRVSVWTDPDTTDDDTAGGQFWVMIDPARTGDRLSSDVHADVTIRALDRPGPSLTARAAPVSGDASRQFVALRMDHEGRFAVRVDVEGAAGRVSVDSEVQATYDLRPSPLMLLVYLRPFVLTGFLWTTLLVRRRRAAHARAAR